MLCVPAVLGPGAGAWAIGGADMLTSGAGAVAPGAVTPPGVLEPLWIGVPAGVSPAGTCGTAGAEGGS